jgi:hypothetical protein
MTADGPTRRWWWNGIAPCALVAAVSAAVLLGVVTPAYVMCRRWEAERQFLKNYRAPGEAEIINEIPMRYAMTSNEYNEVIFLGGSTCTVGVDACRFERETGSTAYNLGGQGYIGLGGYLVIGERYLEHHPRPKVLCLCIHPRELWWDYDERDQKDVRRRFYLAYGEGEGHTTGDVWDCVQEGVRIAFGRLRGGVSYYSEVPAHRGKSFNCWLKEVRECRGFVRPPATSRAGGSGSEMERLAVSEDHMRQLRRFVQWTRKNAMRLVIRLTPVIGSSTSTDSSAIEAGLGELRRGWADVVVSKPEVLRWRQELFLDEHHLNAEGAAAFTTLVASEVSEVLGLKGDRRGVGVTRPRE